MGRGGWVSRIVDIEGVWGFSMSAAIDFPGRSDEPKTDSADSTSFAITPTQSRLSANETAPHLNPVIHSASCWHAKPVHTCLATRMRVSARPLRNTTLGDGLNRQYQCQARYGTRSVLHVASQRTCFLLTRRIVPQQPRQRYHPNFLPQNGPRSHQTD